MVPGLFLSYLFPGRVLSLSARRAYYEANKSSSGFQLTDPSLLWGAL